MYVGKKVTRVDAYDKVIGRTKYTDDLCDKSAYIARILHSTIANGRVLSIDTSEAEKIPGVVKVFTCFDLKEKHYFPTAGHPWSTDKSHQDVADRHPDAGVLRAAGGHRLLHHRHEGQKARRDPHLQHCPRHHGRVSAVHSSVHPFRRDRGAAAAEDVPAIISLLY